MFKPPSCSSRVINATRKERDGHLKITQRLSALNTPQKPMQTYASNSCSSAQISDMKTRPGRPFSRFRSCSKVPLRKDAPTSCALALANLRKRINLAFDAGFPGTHTLSWSIFLGRTTSVTPDAALFIPVIPRLVSPNTDSAPICFTPFVPQHLVELALTTAPSVPALGGHAAAHRTPFVLARCRQRKSLEARSAKLLPPF